MPIFARTKIMLSDDCIRPGHPILMLNYSGPNPQELYKKSKELFFSVWNIHPSDVQEREFNWDRTAGAEKFSVKFEVTKDLDVFSYMLIRVNLSGEAKHSRQFGKEGTAKLDIEAMVRTEYPQDTLWQRSLFYEMFRVFWHKTIYEDARKKFIRECRETSFRFLEEIKSFLNTLPKIK